MSYTEFVSNCEPTDKIYIAVEHDSVISILNFKKVLHGHPRYRELADWAALEAALDPNELVFYIEDTIIPSMAIDKVGANLIPVESGIYPTFKVTGPTIHSVSSDNGVRAGYGNHENSVRDDVYSSWMSPDVILTDETAKLHLNSIVPFCNGVACFPLVNNNEMFALGGCAFLKEDRKWTTRDVTLVDFSPLGDVQLVPFKDCTITGRTTGTKRAMQLKVPVDIKGKTVIMMLAGRMIYPHQLKLISDDTYYLDLDQMGFRNIVIDNKLKSGDNEFNTMNYYDDDMDGAVLSLGSDTDTTSFLVIIDNPDVVVSEYPAMHHLMAQGHLFRLFTSGFLTNKKTLSIAEYVRVDYDRAKLLSATTSLKYYTVVQDNPENNNQTVGGSIVYRMECPTERHHDGEVFKSSLDADFSLITISSKEN